VRRYGEGLGGLVLDVGCGYRPLANCVTAQRYIGLDYDPDQDVDVVGSALRLPFHDQSVDSALCTEVLEHVSDPALVLTELWRVLKPDGTLLITVPMSWGLHYEPYDYFRFTCYGLDHLVRSAGFEVVGVERLGGVFSLIGARLADLLLMQTERRLRVLPAQPRLGLGLCAALPVSLTFYCVGRLLDRIDRADAIGWVMLVRKRRSGHPE